jgi:hypothetical protein
MQLREGTKVPQCFSASCYGTKLSSFRDTHSMVSILTARATGNFETVPSLMRRCFRREDRSFFAITFNASTAEKQRQ